ncbi:peptidase M23 [Paenibacillus sp. CAA11]|uniref:M23 family metallopeptidase n=1 Tax=Paenibacillus sp. CAA11 TaxID=1532905 RepID=UPI000D390131|nr:M23 family metallopeptidase [Paenibacillus sp. CAA11]AWB45914.1 peptidase M23 [Paenibacillus sp. CAA11]
MSLIRIRNSKSARLTSYLLLIAGTTTALLLASSQQTASAELPQKQAAKPDIYTERKSIYEEIGELTQIPWFRLAAIDQYERSLTPKAKLEARKSRLIHLEPKAFLWAGRINPDTTDTNPVSIGIFGGIGKDASGDGIADPANDRDAIYSMARYLQSYGPSEDDFSIAVWRYYQNDRAVERIRQFTKIYKTYNTLNLQDTSFPLPLTSVYSYRDTWGDRRGYGGNRIHEGTDLFASYGVPVRSTCYGIVETKGWNRFGGWRIGIRDLQNRYHYYAHLLGYDKTIEIGGTVKPGQVVGWVGSSGYGGPGTQGKFPPHLHYGIYRDTGHNEWAFDPYPLLRQWEQAERSRHK